MYNTPYGVLTDYFLYGNRYDGAYDEDVSVNIPHYGGIDNILSVVINIIDTAADNEAAREEKFFNQYIDMIPEGTQLRQDFDQLIKSKNYSQAFDVLQKGLNDIYDFNKTLEQNQKEFAEINDLFLNKNIINILADELGKLDHVTTHADFIPKDLDITGAKLLDNILDKVFDKATKQLKTDKQINFYKQFLVKIRILMEQIFIDSYGPNVLTDYLSELESNKKVKKQRTADRGKHANDPLNQLVWNQVWGLLNGIPNEVMIDLTGGVKTGTVKNAKGQNIKGDAYTLMTASGGFALQEGTQAKADFQQITRKNELEQFLNEGRFQDNFIIISSAKDQSLSADFNNKFSTGNIKFAEPASLEERIGNIRDFAQAANVGGSGINDLIFALANLEDDMVCSGQIQAIKQVLGALCVNWMFDDFGDLVMNVSLQNSATKICVYYINGWYYTLSDILKRTANKIHQKQASDLVYVGLSIPKSSSYGEAAKTTPQGLERWNATRANIMSRTKLRFDLKVKNLFDAFYQI